MTNPEQTIRHCAHLARNAMIAEIAAHWNEIVDLSVTRSQPGSIGHQEHGNSSFQKPETELRRERFEEYADALFYYQVQHRYNRE